ncbi:MAG: hypothetical protein GXY09_00170 [Bacteroidales bacterium]|nr:hypothetical protein [Bacteroidales bacterium]
MKHKRLLPMGLVVMSGMLSFSCIDKTFDMESLSTKMELFSESMDFPIGKTTIYLDSVISGLDADTTVLRVENGVYVFRYAGSMDMSGLTNELSGFSLEPMTGVSGKVNMFDATGLSTPYDIPPMVYSYNGSASITLPTFSTNLITVDSVVLKNTFMQIRLGNTGLGGTKLSESIQATFTAQGNGAVYYVDGEEKTTWTVRMGETKQVEIRKLRLTGGTGSLTLNEAVTMSILTAGDVTAEQPVQTTLDYTITMSPVDFDVVYGKVNYELNNTPLDPINFDALGDLLGDNDVLSFYNPTIKVTTTGNLGVPVDINLNMSTTNSTTGNTASLTNTILKMQPASAPGETKVNNFVIDNRNGTDDLFKINPDRINMGYSVKTDLNTTNNHFIAKNSTLSMDYAMEIPLQFGSDLNLNISQTMDSPVGDLGILDDQDDLVLGLSLNVSNRIPLGLRVQLTALNEDSVDLFTAMSETIAAAPVDPLTGKATGVSETTTSIDLTSTQINLLKQTKQFRVGFVITAAGQGSYVSVQQDDYIDIKVGLKTEGGLIIDPSNLSTDE